MIISTYGIHFDCHIGKEETTLCIGGCAAHLCVEIVFLLRLVQNTRNELVHFPHLVFAFLMFRSNGIDAKCHVLKESVRTMQLLRFRIVGDIVCHLFQTGLGCHKSELEAFIAYKSRHCLNRNRID